MNQGNGWSKSKTESLSGSRLDNVGAALEIINRADGQFNITHIQTLLAVAAESSCGEWTELSKIKAKMPNIGNIRLGYTLWQLSGMPGVPRVFNRKLNLIDVCAPQGNDGEREYRLTNYGKALLNKSMKAIDSHLSRDKICYKQLRYDSCHMRITGNVVMSTPTKDYKKPYERTERLLLSSNNHCINIAKGHSAMLAQQSIASGAVVCWFSFRTDLNISVFMYAGAESEFREESHFELDGSGNTISLLPKLFERDGILFNTINDLEEDGDYEEFLSQLLTKLAIEASKRFEVHKQHTHIIISSLPSLKVFRAPRVEQALDKAIDSGAIINIIDETPEASESYAYDSRFINDKGFAHATFRFQPKRPANHLDIETMTFSESSGRTMPVVETKINLCEQPEKVFVKNLKSRVSPNTVIYFESKDQNNSNSMNTAPVKGCEELSLPRSLIIIEKRVYPGTDQLASLIVADISTEIEKEIVECAERAGLVASIKHGESYVAQWVNGFHTLGGETISA